MRISSAGKGRCACEKLKKQRQILGRPSQAQFQRHSAGADQSRVRLGALEGYYIPHKCLTNPSSQRAVGLYRQVAGLGNFSNNPSETDMILRNVFTGGLEVYDISNNQLTGAAFIGTVGLDWQFAGIAPILRTWCVRLGVAQRQQRCF